jgi:ABC-type glycerol-3-phosphate transport system substrate-binding protein
MKFLAKVALLLFVIWILPIAFARAAAGGPALQKAKQAAEARGYSFITSHDEIVARAKKEGDLRILGNIEPPVIKAATAAFMKKYPFLNVVGRETTGSDAAQRTVLELKSGAAREWDTVGPTQDFRSEYLPYLWKIDILGMAEQGVLKIPPAMIDSINRNMVSFSSRFSVVAYNKNLVPPDQVPKRWEDLVRPEFKGKKFAADVRPTEIAELVPAWGLQKTIDFARKIKDQQPIWVRGATRTFAAITAGEIPMMIGVRFHSVRRSQLKDHTGMLQYSVLEPVPLSASMPLAVLASAQHPHAALLLLEWFASPEGQKIIDDYEPLGSSVYVLGGAVEQEVRGKKLSVLSWEHYQVIDQWISKVFEAYGFPAAESAK